MRAILQEGWQQGFPNEFREKQEKGPIEEASLEFHPVRPSEPPLEWRRLLIDPTKQAADDTDDQTCKKGSPEVFDI